MSQPGVAAVNRNQLLHAVDLSQVLRKGALLEAASAQTRREMEQQEVLTQDDVAALLRVERHHIAKLIKRGLPCVRIGSMRRFLRKDVMAWLQDQKETE